MDSRALVAVGPRVPETLGNFRLDDHNVEEWSDTEIPGIRHKARKETGKWINPDTNADIQFQKRQDRKESQRGKEETRTEVIQGQAPDSTFQIVRSHTQFKDSNDNFTSRQSSSTSYQMSSSRGVRSTSKSSSNRTTTKTVTVSEGRSDDFENLGMSFQPLDTSTQRERINVSRSGTMGVRRPPTRRHTPATPATAVSTSPEDNEIDTRDEIIVDSDDNMRNTPDLRSNTPKHPHDQSRLSIVGFKDISPKIRVGFPVEIQLELQTKLRSSSYVGRSAENDDDMDTFKEPNSANTIKDMGSRSYHSPKVVMQDSYKEIQQMERDAESATPLFPPSNNADPTFDFKQRKSYGLESVEHGNSQTLSQLDIHPSRYTNSFSYLDPTPLNLMDHVQPREKSGGGSEKIESMSSRLASHVSKLSPTSVSRSWDLIHNAHTAQQKREDNKKLFNSNATMNPNSQLESESLFVKSAMQSNPFRKSFVNLKPDKESQTLFDKENYLVKPLHSSSATQILDLKHRSDVANTEETETPVGYTPDVLSPTFSTLSPSLERSRRLLQMLDETPDILHKMSFKNYYSDGLKSEERKESEKESSAWETQRQLSFLNESLTRILEDRINTENNNYYDHTTKKAAHYDQRSDEDTSPRRFAESFSKIKLDESDVDINGNVRSKIGQVSHTWISSGDPHKPAQKVRDNDVTTSISATHDPFKRGPKKVEFCKTEVHFTPDSGKFHIVETDENKPSTSHLFRKKKKGDKSKQEQKSSTKPTSVDSSIVPSLVSTEGETDANGLDDTVSNGDSQDHKLETRTSADENLMSTYKPRSESDQGNVSIQKMSQKMSTTNSLFKSNTISSVSEDESVSQLRDRGHKTSPLSELRHNGLTNEEYFDRGQSSVRNSANQDNDVDDVRSPSHVILANYGEMKIQRYLNHLKSPSSANSESTSQVFDFPSDPDHDNQNTFRFDNVLYEHGSFVPLATRRSLIEMNNNRNRRRTTTSHTSGNSSTMSNYSLPTSDKEGSTGSQPIRRARMEAKVATGRPHPQITSVELRYEFDNERPYNPEPIMNRQIKIQKETEKEKRLYIPSPVMPSKPSVSSDNERYPFSRENGSFGVSENEVSDNGKTPNPNTPFSHSRTDRRSGMLERSYYKNPLNESNMDMTGDSGFSPGNELPMSTSTILSKFQNKGSSKSIVTIGGYDVGRNSSKFSKMDDSDKSEPSPEPVLSMDHTWKGPAHFGTDDDSSKPNPVGKALTLPKLIRNEPEWVSKARSRESRMTDWEMVGKQSVSVTPVQSEQPPWIDDLIRYRSKSTAERVKTLPKISVVYPWQRDSDTSRTAEDTRSPEKDVQGSHIVSIVPTPPLLSFKTEHSTDTFVHHGVSHPKSIAELPMLQICKDDVIDRDSDTILINAAQIINKHHDGKNPGKIKHDRFSSPSTNISHSGTYAKIPGVKSPTDTRGGKHSTDSSSKHRSGLTKSGNKDQSTLVNLNTVKATVRPPIREEDQKPRKTTDTTPKQKSSNKGTKKLDKESSGSSRSNTPIHRHQLVEVKVSKLPVRRNLAQKTESKVGSSSVGSKTKNKDKHTVPVDSDVKKSSVRTKQPREDVDSAVADSAGPKSQKSGERRDKKQSDTSRKK